jgi:hypothetical protein
VLAGCEQLEIEGVVLSLCTEVIESRALLARLGADLRTVAGRAPRPPG